MTYGSFYSSNTARKILKLSHTRKKKKPSHKGSISNYSLATNDYFCMESYHNRQKAYSNFSLSDVVKVLCVAPNGIANKSLLLPLVY